MSAPDCYWCGGQVCGGRDAVCAPPPGPNDCGGCGSPVDEDGACACCPLPQSNGLCVGGCGNTVDTVRGEDTCRRCLQGGDR
jgi:hypothetical protein